MCGFAGASGSDKLETVQHMLAAVEHRGPDGRGIAEDDGYALGHARLAILDVQGGAQPMRDPESNSQVAFNGEIYNFQELRKRVRGHPFATKSDTETLLKLE